MKPNNSNNHISRNIASSQKDRARMQKKKEERETWISECKEFGFTEAQAMDLWRAGPHCKEPGPLGYWAMLNEMTHERLTFYARSENKDDFRDFPCAPRAAHWRKKKGWAQYVINVFHGGKYAEYVEQSPDDWRYWAEAKGVTIVNG